MTERRLNMIIEKDYFDSEEVRKANAMNDKTMVRMEKSAHRIFPRFFRIFSISPYKFCLN